MCYWYMIYRYNISTLREAIWRANSFRLLLYYENHKGDIVSRSEYILRGCSSEMHAYKIAARAKARYKILYYYTTSGDGCGKQSQTWYKVFASAMYIRAYDKMLTTANVRHRDVREGRRGLLEIDTPRFSIPQLRHRFSEYKTIIIFVRDRRNSKSDKMGSTNVAEVGQNVRLRF